MKTTTVVLLYLSVVCAGSAIAGSDPVEDPSAATGPRLTTERIATDVLGAMDRSADPCVDFYQYACGTWVANTEIPPDRPRWVRSFSVLREQNREVIRELIEGAATASTDDPTQQLIGTYYGACMDAEAVEKAGTAPLAPLFDKIATIEDASSLFKVAGELHRMGVGSLFGIGFFEDLQDPDFNVAHLVQGGLGLPDRDYYVSDDPKKQELLAEYQQHVTRMFTLLGEDPETAGGHAADVVAFETGLADASRDRTAMRDLEKQVHRVDRAGLQKVAPGLPWDAFFAGSGHAKINDINVRTPEFFEALDKALATTGLEKVRTYMRWKLVDSMADQLPEAFVNANFEFYGATLSGQKEIQPRWKRCVNGTSGALGEAVGRLYVDRMFAGDSKDKALEMIHDIEAAFEANLTGVDWMDDETRGRALVKLEAVRNKIGYPDKWRDYSDLKLTRDSYFGNAIATSAFEFDFQADKAGEPVDKDEWQMTPQTVNAGYSPLGNEIMFPAGILQPPFFHRDFPAAMNYGAMGLGIGHELTHGYDDQGRKFDATGKLREWWEPEVSARYEERAQCVADYYSRFEVEPGVNVNGELTLGENIADIGGLKLAYNAYKLWQQRHGEPEPPVEGLTDEQLLFVAAAQTWCSKVSPEFLRMQVTTDPHSPPQFRVMGPMANVPQFAAAFGCEPGQPMRPEEICTVW